MAPLPKRKHSTRRTGKRLATLSVKFKNLVICKNCGKKKLPHNRCKYCKK